METLPCVVLDHIGSFIPPELQEAHGIVRYKDYRYDSDPTSFSFGRTLVYKVESAFHVLGVWCAGANGERFVLACGGTNAKDLFDALDDSPYIEQDGRLRRWTGDQFDPFIDVPRSRRILLRRRLVLNKSITLVQIIQGFDIGSEHLKHEPVQPARKRYITASWCL